MRLIALALSATELLFFLTAAETAEQKAHKWSPENVVDFLRRIGLGKYASKFLDEDVDGSTLLMANEETFGDLGVKSVLDRVRIMVLYRRELQEGDGSEPVRALQDLLKKDFYEFSQFSVKIEFSSWCCNADIFLLYILTQEGRCHDELSLAEEEKESVHLSEKSCIDSDLLCNASRRDM